MSNTSQPPVASLVEELNRLARGFQDKTDRAPDDPRMYFLRMQFWAGAHQAFRLMDATLKALTDTNEWDKDGMVSDMMFHLWEDLNTIKADIFNARSGGWSGVPRTN